jgi:hydroxymethylpyrimidine pyrophosphatase-like HAD family hydrolase
MSVGKSLGLDLLVFYKEHVYCSEFSDAVKRHMMKDKVEITLKSFDWFYEITDSVNKLMLIGPSDAIERFQQYTKQLNTVQSEPIYLEILPPNINKGTALLQLIDLMRGHPDEFTAVGDNLNDLEMIGMLRQGVAVRNAHPKLKDVAAWVTLRSNDENALVEVIDYVERASGLV